MVDYVSLAATALRLINENGRDVTIRLKDRTPVNVAAPWDGPGISDTDVAAKAVNFPFEAADIDGEIVRREDKRYIVAASAVGANDIEDFDEIIDATENFKIVTVEVLQPGDTRILYIIQARK